MIAGGGIALLLFSFLPWFAYEIPSAPDYTETAWGDLVAIVAVSLAVSLTVLLGVVKWLSAGGRRRPPEETFLLGSSTVCVLLLVKVLTRGEHSGVALENRIGIFLGLLAGTAMTVGAWLKCDRPIGPRRRR